MGPEQFFFEFGVEPSTLSLMFARRWRKYKARLANSGRSVVNETPVMVARETFLERLYRFNQHLLLPRLAHLGADATTPAQRPRIRIVQQKLVPGFERLIPTLATEVRLGLAHGRGIFAFEVVDTNVNMMRAMFKLSLHRFQFLGRSRGCSCRRLCRCFIARLSNQCFFFDPGIQIVDLASLAPHMSSTL